MCNYSNKGEVENIIMHIDLGFCPYRLKQFLDHNSMATTGYIPYTVDSGA